MNEFTVGGVKYRTDASGTIEVQMLDGSWQPWNASAAASTGTAQAVQSAAQTAQGGAAAAAAAATPGPNTLDALAAGQGEGWTIPKGTKPTQAIGDDGVPIPNTYTVVANGPGGAQRVITITAPAGPGPTDPRALAPESVDWTVINVAEPVKAPTQTPAEKNAAVALAQAQTNQLQAQIDQINKDEAERAKNANNGKGRITDKEVAQLDALAAQTGVSQGQLQLARDQMVQNGENQSAQLKIAQGQLVIAQANQNLAERRANIEADLAAGKLTNDQARLALDQDQQVWNKQIEQARLDLQQLTANRQNVIAEGQLAVSQQQLAQQAAQAKQAAETAQQTAATNLAGTVYSAERNAQQEAARTGQNLLQQRASTFQNLASEPFTAAAGLSRGSAGKYGMLSGGGVHIPPGTVGGLLQGAQGLSTAMYGGQNSIDSAIKAIEAIRPGASMTPMGQAASAFASMIFDRANAIVNKGNVNAPNTAGPPAAAPAAPTPTGQQGLISPLTTTPANAPVSAVPGFNTLGPIMGTPGTGGGNAYGATPPAPTLPPVYAQSGQPEGGGQRRFTAPNTAPTVNLYIGGGG